MVSWLHNFLQVCAYAGASYNISIYYNNKGVSTIEATEVAALVILE